MSRRTLIVLGLLLLLLAGLHGLGRRARTRPEREAPARTGAPLLPGFVPSAVAALEVARPARTDRIERADGGWIVASAHGYRADLGRLVDVVRRLDELKVGAVIRGGEERLADFGLAPGDDPEADRPATLRLFDEAGTRLAELTVGNARVVGDDRVGGWPDGAYVRVGEGPVLLIGESMADLPRRAEDWMRRELTEIPERQVRSIRLARDGTVLELARDEEETWRLAGLDEAVETLNRGRVEGLAGALEFLRFDRLPDPGLADEATGLDSPAVATFAFANGLRLEVRVGGTPEDSTDRYVRFSVPDADAAAARPEEDREAGGEAGEIPAEEPEGPTLEELRRIEGWLYLLRSTAADPFLSGRDDLVDPVEEEDPSEADGDETPAAMR